MRLPRSLLAYGGGKPVVQVDAPDVAAALEAVARAHPGLRDRIVDETGRIREHVHLFVNRAAIRDPSTELKEGDVVHVLPAVSGGCS